MCNIVVLVVLVMQLEAIVMLLQRFASEDRLNAHCDSSHYIQHLLAVLPNGITDMLSLI